MDRNDHRSLEEIINEVSRYVPSDSSADLTNSVVESAKWAFRALKSDAAERHVCEPKMKTYTPVNGVVELPVETLRVVDVAIGRLSLRENVGADGRFKSNPLSPRFERYGTRIMVDRAVTVTFLKIPTDGQGRIVVPDRLFTAIVFHVASKEALGRASSNPQLFAVYDRMKIEAGNAIDSARADMNSAGWNEMLDFMASTRRNYKTDYDL